MRTIVGYFSGAVVANADPVPLKSSLATTRVAVAPTAIAKQVHHLHLNFGCSSSCDEIVSPSFEVPSFSCEYLSTICFCTL